MINRSFIAVTCMSALLTACQRDDSPPAAVSAPAAPAKASVAVNPLDLMETDGLLQRIGVERARLDQAEDVIEPATPQ